MTSQDLGPNRLWRRTCTSSWVRDSSLVISSIVGKSFNGTALLALLQPQRASHHESVRSCAGNSCTILLLLCLLCVSCLHLEDRCGFYVLEGRGSSDNRCSGSISRVTANILIALSPCFSVRNPGLYLLSDHLFCFAADLMTMKRPQSFLFFMQASTGYVHGGTRMPLSSLPGSPMTAKHTA